MIKIEKYNFFEIKKKNLLKKKRNDAFDVK